jgi:hypothetical protein
MDLAKYFQTIKHLKPIQLYGRVLFILKRKIGLFGKPSRSILTDAKAFKEKLTVSEEKPLELSFLNKKVSFEISDIPWNARKNTDNEQKIEKLWQYNLNYFDYLFDGQIDSFSPLAEYLILDWIEKNSKTTTESWEPYPISKRIVNWCRWLEQHPCLQETTRLCIMNSLVSQCKRLFIDLEFHNQANHLLENLKALFITANFTYFNLEDYKELVEKWLQTATENLLIEINEQFFEDGGHYERSPMYHKEMMEGVEEILASIKTYSPQKHVSFAEGKEKLLDELKELCQTKLPAMKQWLAIMTHPDGKVAQFNDCAKIKGETPVQLESDRPASTFLPESGYFVRIWPDAYFALSCKEPTPAYQPGHTHCDIFSYELSLGKLRTVIDTGCGSYQNPEIRKNCRKSASHNIPLIELSEQSQIWGSFRMGQRAVIEKFDWSSERSSLQLAMRDYLGQRYTREVIFEEKSIRFRDRMYDRKITGTFCSYIHLSPEVSLLPGIDQNMNFTIGQTEFQIKTAARTRFEICKIYPEFGVEKQAEKLILSNPQSEAIDYVITWK